MDVDDELDARERLDDRLAARMDGLRADMAQFHADLRLVFLIQGVAIVAAIGAIVVVVNDLT